MSHVRCLSLTIDCEKYACFPITALPADCMKKKPEGLGIITSTLISFVKLSFAATCADALEGPSAALHALPKRETGKTACHIEFISGTQTHI